MNGMALRRRGVIAGSKPTTRLRSMLLALALSAATYAHAAETAVPAADPAVAAIAARLADPATLRGRFEQEKQLAGFRNPLRSSGTFLLVRGRGIAWDTTAPFAASAVLTTERLSTRLPDGSTRVLMDAAATPATAAVTTLLLALVGGDFALLADRFDIAVPAGQGDATARWTMELRPRDPTLAKAIAGITLQGDTHVDEVQVREAGGDVAILRFGDLSEAPPATATEAARFD